MGVWGDTFVSKFVGLSVQGLLLFVKIIIHNYILYCLSILILRDQSNATVDVCATADPAEKKPTVGLLLQVRLCQSRTMFWPRLARTGVLRPISTKISFLYGTEMKQ